MKVLYVEDNPLDADLVLRRLRRLPKLRVRHAATLREARASLTADGAPQVLLTDLALPDGAGLDLVREARALGLPTAVVVLTGSGDERRAAEALRAGADDYVVKRADCLDALPEVIEAAWLRFQEKDPAPRALRVLYAEPNPTDAELARRHFQRHAPEIELHTVPAAASVLAALPSSQETECPWDVLLLDYRLGGSSGLDLLEDLCRRRLNRPVIIITGQGGEEAAGRALRLGAADYLVKHPGHLEMLPHAIWRAHQRHQNRREQEALRTSEARFRRLTERLGHYLTTSPTITYAQRVEDSAARLTWVSENVTRILGYDSERVLEPGWWAAQLHEEDRAAAQRAFAELAAGARESLLMEYRLRDAGGGWRLIREEARLRRDDEGGTPEIVGTWTDVTSNRQAQLDMQAERAFSQTLIESLPGLFFLIDGAGRPLRWNRHLEEFLGLSGEELRKRVALEFVPEEDQPAVAAAIARVLIEGAAEVETRVVARGGEIRHILFNGRRLMVEETPCLLVVGIDTTEQRRLEAQLLRAQRQESVGRLASGLAHDLNNLLAPLMMAPDIVRLKVADPSVLAIMDTIENNTKRGAGIIRQLLTFGRGVEGRRTALRLPELVREMEDIMRATFPKNIRLYLPETEAAEPVWTVLADPTQVHQVLMNLCVNARDAMPDGGDLTISLQNVELDEAFARMTPGARPGRHVQLAVSDTGCGIPPEHLEQVFDPFFTTKEPGKGTGLGLSTVLGIVKSHGGFVLAQSRLGEGSRFSFYLPAEVEPRPAAPEAEPEPVRAAPANGQWVLLVDDEPEFRAIVRELLERHGYQVLEAEDGAVGISLCAQNADKLAAVITDLVMPCMDGRMLLLAARRLPLKAGLILVSGQPVEPRLMEELRQLADEVLTKPFATAELLAALEHAGARGARGRQT